MVLTQERTGQFLRKIQWYGKTCACIALAICLIALSCLHAFVGNVKHDRASRSDPLWSLSTASWGSVTRLLASAMLMQIHWHTPCARAGVSLWKLHHLCCWFVRLIFHLSGIFFLYVRHRIMTDGKAVKVIDLYKVIKNKCDEVGTRCGIFLDDQPNVVSYQYAKSYYYNTFVYRKRISSFETI